MTRTIRVVGACLALAGSTLTTIVGIILAITAVSMEQLEFSSPIITGGFFSLIGGILLIKDQTFGGIFCFIGAGIQLVAILIAAVLGFGSPIYAVMAETQQIYLQAYVGFSAIQMTCFFIDPGLVITGGILGIISGEKWSEYDQTPTQ